MENKLSIDEVVDAIIDILDYDTWKQVGAFMEDAHAALHLPIEPHMWWSFNPYTNCAKIKMNQHTNVAVAYGDTVAEACCRAWLQWKQK